jgi:hypothetical protein
MATLKGVSPVFLSGLAHELNSQAAPMPTMEQVTRFLTFIFLFFLVDRMLLLDQARLPESHPMVQS